MHFPTTTTLTSLLLTLTPLLTLTAAVPNPNPNPDPATVTTTIATVVAASTPASTALLNCGNARYLASKYTCYNNKSLCPVSADGKVKFQLCEGDGGCFDPAKYKCVDGHLRTL